MKPTPMPENGTAESWRNRPVERECTKCSTVFVGKYNSTSCPPCKEDIRAAAFREFKKKNPDYWSKWQKTEAGQKSRKKVILSGYGLSVEAHRSLVEKQGNVCAICGSAPGAWRANGGGLVIDHDHSTGMVRGLLCPSCNRGLGQFEDDPTRLLSAAKYLTKERNE